MTTRNKLRLDRRAAAATLATALFVATAVAFQSLQAQTFTVLHTFTAGADGATPNAGLIMDRAGNLYGTGSKGGLGYGTVFRLARKGSGWTFTPLYQFQGRADGSTPMGALALGPDGTLYGSTEFGGTFGLNCGLGCGLVFNLKPPPTRPNSVLSPWNESVLYSFPEDWTTGSFPFSEVTFDVAGNLYGTTYSGGALDDRPGECNGVNCGGCEPSCGVVYQLSPSNGGWTQSVLFRFNSSSGSNPTTGLILDSAGNLYGLTSELGYPAGCGSVYELSPGSSGWTEQTLHSFGLSDGGYPWGSLIRDSAGNIYVGTVGGQCGGDGAVIVVNGGNWGWAYQFAPGEGPTTGLTMDAAGSLYGATAKGGTNNAGVVFKLTPSGGGWSYTTLYDFDGFQICKVRGKLLLDASGNIYGVSDCGVNNYGNVWELTP